MRAEAAREQHVDGTLEPPFLSGINDERESPRIAGQGLFGPGEVHAAAITATLPKVRPNGGPWRGSCHFLLVRVSSAVCLRTDDDASVEGRADPDFLGRDLSAGVGIRRVERIFGNETVVSILRSLPRHVPDLRRVPVGSGAESSNGRMSWGSGNSREGLALSHLLAKAPTMNACPFSLFSEALYQL